MRLEFLEQDIGRNLKDDIRDEENGQRGVIFGPLFDIQVLFQPHDGRITDIDSANRPNPLSATCAHRNGPM